MFDLNDICAADRSLQRGDDDGWVTINGTHVLISGGKATGGAAGSRLSGYDFSKAKSTKSKAKSSAGSFKPKKLTSTEGVKVGDRIKYKSTGLGEKYETEFTVTQVDKEKGRVFGVTDDGMRMGMDKWSFGDDSSVSFTKIGEAGGSTTKKTASGSKTKKTTSSAKKKSSTTTQKQQAEKSRQNYLQNSHSSTLGRFRGSNGPYTGSTASQAFQSMWSNRSKSK